MYQIISNGKALAICEEPRWVKYDEYKSCYVQCGRDEAELIAVKGELYSFNDRFDDFPKAQIVQIDGGEYVFKHDNQVLINTQNILDIETALCELDV